MANVLIENTTMQKIANSIRAKTGKTYTMLPSEMPDEIASIETGGGGGYSRPTDWLAIPTMSGTSDEVYILNGS
jgi:hypothetical protein